MNVPESEEELSFYRAIEDFFATVRGVPHVLSPKDFQLLRGWWRDKVPLAAITNGVTEVLAKRRDRGENDPVVSLSYCRHAVNRHTKRLAEMHVGEADAELYASRNGSDVQALSTLTARLHEAGSRWRQQKPEVAAAIDQIADQLERTPDMPPALLEEHLFSVEAVLLDRCWRELASQDREAIERRCDEATASWEGSESARNRTYRAVRDRELRELLDLPRLELG